MAFYLILRVQNARDDGTTYDEWYKRHSKAEPSIDEVIEQAAKHGFEIRPAFGAYNAKEWPLTLVAYVGTKLDSSSFGIRFGRNSTMHSYPCRKAPVDLLRKGLSDKREADERHEHHESDGNEGD